MVKKHPRGAVQLADNDSFCPVNDEGSVIGHQGNFPKIDLLLFNIANRLDAGILIDIPGHQPNLDLHRSGEGHAALMTFFHIVLGRTESIGNIFERTGFTEITNRKNGAKNGFKTCISARRRRQLRLEETLVGILLYLDKVGDINNPRNLGEMFPQKLVIRDGISHVFSFE
jgi:hypothetical protein